MEYGYRSSIKQVEERENGWYMEYGNRSSIKQVEERGKGWYMDIWI